MQYSGTRQNVTYFLAVATLATHFFAPSFAHGAASEWATSEGGDVRLVVAQPLEDGTIPAILDIRLQPGWKTYWLDPGASGIPPQIDFGTDSGVVFSALRFPAPKMFDDGVVRYTGYDSSVALPIDLRQISPGDRTLSANVLIGICKDICIPLQATLDVQLEKTAAENPLDRARIDQAVASLPAAPSSDFTVTSAHFDAGQKRVSLSLTVPDAGKIPDVFLAGPSGYNFGKPENMQVTGHHATIDIPLRLPAKANNSVRDGTIRLVARSGARSVETTLAFD